MKANQSCEVNLNTLPNDLIERISLDLDLFSFIQLNQVNKRFREVMMTEQTIKKYCYNKGIYLIFPQASCNLNELLEGQYYYINAKKIENELDDLTQKNKPLLDEISKLFSSVIIAEFSYGAVQNPQHILDLSEQQYSGEMITLKNELAEKKTDYNNFIDKAISKGHFMAQFTKIENNIWKKKIDDCIAAFEIAEREIKDLKKDFGEIVDLFLAAVYCKYAKHLADYSKSYIPCDLKLTNLN